MRRRGFAMAVGVQDPLALHRSETCFGKPVRPPPSAKTTEASAREAVAELWPSPGKLFREARRASPQRQNNGARARATARVCHGCRGSFGRRPESCFGKPDGPAPSAKITEASASDAPPPRLSRKLRPSPRKFSREARRARPQRQNDGNELSGSPTGQTQAQTFDDSSHREKWHATRPGRVSANPKP